MADEPNLDTPDAGDLNAAARKKLAASGAAMSYPIRPADNHGKADLSKAIHAVGRGSGSRDAIRRHIIKRAKAIGLSDMIPGSWASDGSMKGENSMSVDIERRYTPSPTELRAVEDGKRIGGYGAVFGQLSRNLGGFVEKVGGGAFSGSRSAGWPNVVARYNHDSNLILGTTTGRTLELRVDDAGLWYEVLPPQSRNDILELVQRGDVQHSSFAFRVQHGGDDWVITDQNYPMRVLNDVQLIDVAPVHDPAYPDTTAGLRSLAAHMDASFDEVRAKADEDELRSFFVRSDSPSTKAQRKRTFGPAALAALQARQSDPWA
jgi:HK97 family phage prohead protease